MITQKRLMELLHYNFETGVFTWRVAHNNRCPIGSEAGWWLKGYRILTIDCERISAHRAAWLYVHGKLPHGDLDHKDGNKANNRIANLRIATMSQNLANASRRSDNKSGFKGVHWHDQRKKWTAQITKNGKTLSLGLFATPEEASAVYQARATELFGEFARFTSCKDGSTSPQPQP
jgi:citrate synthase